LFGDLVDHVSYRATHSREDSRRLLAAVDSHALAVVQLPLDRGADSSGPLEERVQGAGQVAEVMVDGAVEDKLISHVLFAPVGVQRPLQLSQMTFLQHTLGDVQPTDGGEPHGLAQGSDETGAAAIADVVDGERRELRGGAHDVGEALEGQGSGSEGRSAVFQGREGPHGVTEVVDPLGACHVQGGECGEGHRRRDGAPGCGQWVGCWLAV